MSADPHPMIRVDERYEAAEDWTGLASSTDRRKLQNRLNQRASRRRKVIREIETGVTRRHRGRPAKVKPLVDKEKKPPRTDELDSCGVEQQLSSLVAVETPSPQKVSATAAGCHRDLQSHKRRAPKPGETFFICDVDSPHALQLIYQMKDKVHQGMLRQWHGTLPSSNLAADMLLTLTQFNVFRAIFTNMTALNISLDEIKEDIISRFNHEDYNDDNMLLPPSLRPTMLQKSIKHHPWIDPFPLPSLRDALLLPVKPYIDTELCNDLIGHCGLERTGQVGIINWGEPWDPYGWEMTESFARKWIWLFKGCKELMVSTNYWRAQRGEKKLFVI